MIRTCFLCHAETEKVFSTTWVLPGLAPTEIGFSVCPQCGSVSQSPTVPFDDMMRYYATMAVYNNPGRNQKPTGTKVRDLDEQIQFIKRGMGHLPSSALQIGSSDGYTLSRFRDAGVERVLGVEPSAASIAVAEQLYQVDCIHGSAEAFTTDEVFDLILMTHVLEHLYEPQQVLQKCAKLQHHLDEGFIYIEVPLIAPVTSLCPGFFAFEHINYYTRENLFRSLQDAGYHPVSTVEHFNSNLSPIIGVLASTRPQRHYAPFHSAYETNKQLLQSYRQKEVTYWQNCLNGILPQLDASQRTFLWGAGVHTCQLVANTDLLEQCTISGLTDISDLKWGIRQGDWQCQSPDSIDWRAGDRVIISSYALEKEIYDSLHWLRDKGVLTLRLHNVDDTGTH